MKPQIIEIAVRLIGMGAAVVAILNTRSAQGATAWAVSLLSYPIVALPAYLLFGFNRFKGYVRARRIDDDQARKTVNHLRSQIPKLRALPKELPPGAEVYEKLAALPFLSSNRLELLVDGQATFEAIFAAIDQAQNYVLLQFYILRADAIGEKLFLRLTEARRRGVKVYVLYDSIGSHETGKMFFKRFRAEGIDCRPFLSTKSLRARIQANFRNHRKLVVTDGRVAFVGGHNVGDEYLGLDPHIGHWRDTHVQVEGPAVLQAQMTFIEDWYWTTSDLPRFDWPEDPRGDVRALFLSSGPADSFETCGSMFVHAINSAAKRVWIATPYFIPSPQVMEALHLAVLRGVDTRLLVAGKSDNAIADYAAYTYVEDALRAGVKVDWYMRGFSHQKVFLSDDEFACVTSANCDPRSFGLNFELSMIAADRNFNAQVAAMLEKDFGESEPADLLEFEDPKLIRRIATRAARLLSPLL